MTRQIIANDRPSDLTEWRKTATTFLEWVAEPFQVTTMEGSSYVIDETAEHWRDGYWVSWPTDGTDPYPVAPAFVDENYERVDNEPGAS